MSFFHNLNKKLDGIAATPESKQGNESVVAESKFSNLAKELEKNPKIKNPAAVAATIGREKYGQKAMTAKAVAGKKKTNEELADEGNAFTGKLKDTPKGGKFELGGKTFTDTSDVDEGLGDVIKKVGGMAKKAGSAVLSKVGHGSDADMIRDLQKKMGVAQTGEKPKQVKEKVDPEAFAALAPPRDKITFADKIAGAKKEVDEMLGDVAAEAMKKAVVGLKGEAEMDESDYDIRKDPTYKKYNPETHTMMYKDGKHKLVKHDQVADAKSQGWKVRSSLKAFSKGQSSMDEGWDDMLKDVEKRRSGLKTGEKMQGHKGEIEKTATGIRHTRKYDPKTGETDSGDDEKPTGEKRGRGRPKKTDKAPERVTAKAYKHKGGRKMSEEEIQEAIAALEECGYSVSPLEEKAPPGAKAERMVKHIKKAYAKDGKLTPKEKSIAYATAWKAHNKGKVEEEDSESEKDTSKEDAPKKSKSKFKFGGSVYESLDAQLETLITEGMSVTVNMSKDSEDGHPGNKSITINADGEDAERLAELLKMAGLGQHQETCSACGESDCGCDMVDENSPNWPSNTETSDNAMQYSGGLNGPKSTGQSTTPVLASQLRRQVSMEESAKVEQNLLNLYRTFGK